MSDALVELRDVFRVHRTGQGDAAALQGAEFEVRRGEVLCLIGPSGAGKSTVMRLIAGLDTPSAGQVRVLGADIGRRSERARASLRNHHLGIMGQSLDGSAPSALSVSQSVELPLALRGHRRRDRRRRVGELLEAVGLTGRSRAQITELSGGERQRVALCTAVAHRPTLLLADEPTGELDADSAQAVLRLINDVARASGMTVVIASHDPLAARATDRVLTIAGGRIAEERCGDSSWLVINRGGWLRLAPEQRALAGGGSRVRSSLSDGRLLLEATPSASEPVSAPAATLDPAISAKFDPALVEIRSLVRSYGRGAQRQTVLAGLTHRFRREGLTVVTGRSGSGKTTLLRLITGLDQSDEGEVLLDGVSLAGWDREQLASLRRRRVGYMPQEPATVEFLSAVENVALALRLRGVDPREAATRSTVLLGLLGLAERSDQRVHRLSAGEVQRVALARAMAAARGLLILDEPTSRLDEAGVELVAGLLARTGRQHQTVICATHDPRLIEQADDVLAC